VTTVQWYIDTTQTQSKITAYDNHASLFQFSN